MGDELNYAKLNFGFQVLFQNPSYPLITTGGSRYYARKDGLKLDVGSIAASLVFALGREPIIAGKPSPDFFQAALDDMGVKAQDAIMIGDDVVSDIGGSQVLGIFGILVRTGKFTLFDLEHPTIQPGAVAVNFRHAVQMLREAI